MDFERKVKYVHGKLFPAKNPRICTWFPLLRVLRATRSSASRGEPDSSTAAKIGSATAITEAHPQLSEGPRFQPGRKQPLQRRFHPAGGRSVGAAEATKLPSFEPPRIMAWIPLPYPRSADKEEGRVWGGSRGGVEDPALPSLPHSNINDRGPIHNPRRSGFQPGCKRSPGLSFR